MKRQIEHNTQCALTQYCYFKYPDYPWFSVPNAGLRSPQAGMYYKREGLRKGVLDFMFLVPRKGYHGLILEIKTTDGKLTKEQKWFVEAFEKMGYLVKIPRSIDECIKAIEEYMG
jgi:hypothetical protein